MQTRYLDLVWFYIYPVFLSLVFTLLLLPLLYLVDSIVLIFQKAPLLTGSLFYSGSLLLICLLFFAIFFEIIFFLAKNMAVLLSHIPQWLSFLVPGLIVFALVGYPLTQTMIMFTSVNLHQSIMLFSIFIFCLLVAALMVWSWPDFQGFNQAYLLSAVSGSLGFFQLFEDMFTRDILISGAGWFGIVLLTFAIYINLMIRHKMSLDLSLEHYQIPQKIHSLIAVITILTFLLTVGMIHLAYDNPIRYEALAIVSGIVVVLLARWHIFAFGSKIKGLWHYKNVLFLSRRLAVSLLFFYGIALFVFYPIYQISPKYITNLVRANGPSNSILVLTGVILDRDLDNNSFWPGRDPNDEDPCIRFDGPDLCSKQKLKNSVMFASYHGNSHRKIKSHNPGAVNDIYFVSIELIKQSNNDTGLQNQLYRLSQKYRWNKKSVLLPEKNNQSGFENLLAGSNGFDAIIGTSRQSIISKFTDFGYRTICLTNQKKIRNSGSLFKGCQILDREWIESQNPNQIRNHINKYTEHRNLVWFHLVSNPINTIPLMAKLANTINPGSNLVLLVLPQNSTSSLVYSQKKNFYSTSQFQSLPDTLIRAAGGIAGQNDFPVTGIIGNSLLLRSKNNNIHQLRLPRFHYYLIKDQIYYYDSITGANFREDINQLKNNF